MREQLKHTLSALSLVLALTACHAPALGTDGRVFEIELIPQLAEGSAAIPGDARWEVHMGARLDERAHNELGVFSAAIEGELLRLSILSLHAQLTLPSGVVLRFEQPFDRDQRGRIEFRVEIPRLIHFEYDLESKAPEYPVGWQVEAVVYRNPMPEYVEYPAANSQCGEGGKIDFGVVPAGPYKLITLSEFKDWKQWQSGIGVTDASISMPKYPRVLTVDRIGWENCFSTRIELESGAGLSNWQVVPLSGGASLRSWFESEDRIFAKFHSDEQHVPIALKARKGHGSVRSVGFQAVRGSHGGVVRFFGPFEEGGEAAMPLQRLDVFMESSKALETQRAWRVDVQVVGTTSSDAEPTWHRFLVPSGSARASLLERLREELGGELHDESKLQLRAERRIRSIAIFPIRAAGESLETEIPLEFRISAYAVE